MNPSKDHPACSKCQLYKTCGKHPFIAADVPGNERVLFVGEAPGSEESEQGKPFVGKSGEYLRSVVSELGVYVGFTNAVRCRPVDNAVPTTKHITLCKEFLLEDIKNSPAEIIVLLGNTALKSIIGYSGISNWRGKLLEKDGRKYIATFHPSALLREQGRGESNLLENQFLEDMGKIMEVLDGVEQQGADSSFEYKYVDTLSKAREMFEELKKAELCGYDLEFIDLHAFKEGNAILMASFATNNPNRGYALPLLHKETPFTDEELTEVLGMFEEFLTGSTLKIGHNVKIDSLLPYATLGIQIKNVVGDTLLLSKLIDSRPGIHDLKQLAGKHLGMYDYENPLTIYVAEHPEANYKEHGNYSNIPLNILWPYAAKDAVATLLLYSILLSKLDEKQKSLYLEVLVPAIETFTRIEANGCKFDLEIIKKYREIYECENEKLLEKMRAYPQVQELEQELNESKYKGKKQLQDPTFNDTHPRWIKFNPNSPDQISKIVYEKLKFEPIYFSKKTKKPSTDAKALKWYKHEWLDLYRNYKLYSSALSKYLNQMQDWLGVDGRARSSYNIIGTETGRTSSEDPNLQNIPTPEKQPGTLLEKYPIKDIFTSTWEGGQLLAVDYSSMEMRMMATTSQSRAMVKMFNEHKDPHTFVASKLYRIPEAEITKPQRYRAKWVNWTMLYGGGWPTLRDTYNLSEKESKELEVGWIAIFPEVSDFYKEQVKFTKKHGYSVSPLGMRRYLPNITIKARTKEEFRLVSEAEREAANHPIQSVAGQLLIMALNIICNIMQAHNMKSLVINTVHDSILFDVYPGELEEVYKLCMDVLQNIVEYAAEYYSHIDLSWLTVPLEADAEEGQHYGSLKEYEHE